MSETTDFMSLVLNGQVLPFEIDDYVDDWHQSDSDLELHQYLGMDFDEYSLWVSDPNALGLIIAARHQRVPLKQAVNDNIRSTDRLAARAGEARKIARLRRWIEAQPDR